MARAPTFTVSDLSGGDPIVDLLIAARVRMLFNHPFYGQIATRLVYTDATAWCPTAATDGARIYYNREFIKNLHPDELIFLLAHEVMHAILTHMYRRNGRDPKIWNMACDYVINAMLTDARIGKMPAGGLLSKKYTSEWSAEEVYDDLIQNSVEIEFNFDEHLEFDDDEGDDEDEDRDGAGGSGDREGDGEGKSPTEGGSDPVKVRVLGDGPVKLTKKDLRKIKNELRGIVVQAAQSVAAGDVPLGIKRMIAKLLEPELDWRSLLDSKISSMVKDDYTFMRPSRRSHAMKALTGHAIILPGQDFQEAIEVWIFIDASGSLTDEMLRDFLSEVKGIMEAFKDFRINLVSFDTEVYTKHEFTPENINEIYTYQPEGGGGTAFECVFTYLRDNDVVPERLIMLTDGLPNYTWGEPEYCDTMFIVYGDESRKAPFGLTVPYKPRRLKR